MKIVQLTVIVLLGLSSTLSAQNTVTLGTFGFQRVHIPPAGGVNLVGFSFTSPEPIYLVDLFGTNNLVRSTRSMNADKIYIWNGTGYNSYFQKPDGLFYDVLNSSGNPVQVSIKTGTAMFLESPPASTTTNSIIFKGNLLTTVAELQSYEPTFTTFANPYPTPLDLNSTNLNWTAATANRRSLNADKVYIWNEITSQYDSFYFAADRTWTALISSSPQPIIPAGGGAFYEAKSSFTNEIVREFEL